jgi:integrase
MNDVLPRLTLTDLVDVQYVRRRPTARPATLEQYRVAVRALNRHAGRPLYADEICNDLLLGYRHARLESGRPASTINKDLRHLVSLWRLAQKLGYNAMPAPDIEALPEELESLRCLSTLELSQVLFWCRQEKGCVDKLPSRYFWLALVLVMYDSGSRVSALMALRPCDVDLVAGTITLRGSTTKQRRSQVLAISPQTVMAVGRIFNTNRTLLFPWMYDAPSASGLHRWATLRRHYKAILTRAGLPTSRRDLFHKVRRTTATYIANELGVQAAQEHLGHSTPKVTERYLDLSKMTRTHEASKILPRPTDERRVS